MRDCEAAVVLDIPDSDSEREVVSDILASDRGCTPDPDPDRSPHSSYTSFGVGVAEPKSNFQSYLTSCCLTGLLA